MHELSKIKLLGKDCLIQREEEPQATGTVVVQLEDREKPINRYRVMRASAKCEQVSEGDIVLVEFGNHTPPFVIGDKYFAITSEDDVVGVVE